MARPIFVVAKNRSGSKWLSNVVAKHPDVASIQRSGAGGILETNMFENFPRLFGDLTVADNFLGFALCFAETNFFRITELERELLFQKELQKKDYFELFRWIMDEVSKRRGKEFWVQKANITHLEILIQKFPDAAFVVIERDLLGNIASIFGLRRRRGEPAGSLLHEVSACVHARKIYRRFQSRTNVNLVRYERMRGDRESTTRAVCEHIGLKFHSEMLEDSFDANTSFLSDRQRTQVLTSSDQKQIAGLAFLIDLIPYVFLKTLSKWRRKFKVRRHAFVPLTYRLLEIEIGWEPPEAAVEQQWISRPPD